MAGCLIYGANGYTGTLIARLAVQRGHRPILSGRSAAVTEMARQLDLSSRQFALDDAGEIDRGLDGVRVVLNCAGPFSRTARPLAQACLRQHVHYLDVTGEIGVFENLAGMDHTARDAGVMLLPGVGFDVVPTDCLAAHLKRRLPTATRLALGFLALGQVSRGTATTVVENLHRGGAVRKGGVLRAVPAGWKTRTIVFDDRPVVAMTIPWGDVATAWYSTGIPDIEVYLPAGWKLRMLSRLSRPLGWLLASAPVQRWLKRRIQAGPAGPSDEERARGASLVWGEVRDERGAVAVSRLRGPEGYTATALTALAVLERVMAGEVRAGFQTPARMYGPDFILTIPGFERRDE